MKRSRLSRSGSKARSTRLDSQREGFIDSVEFTSHVVREHSMLAHADSLGVQKSRMTLMRGQNPDMPYFIEWEIPGIEEYVEIGIFVKPWHSKKVVDYDGVFELPKQAVALLKKNGFDVSEVVA
jgi:hypothetical protein